MTKSSSVRIVDEVWIATCLLHLEFPDRADFSIEEISLRAEQERISLKNRTSGSIRTCVRQHFVANKPLNSCNVRFLYETSNGRRRLFKPTDPFHVDRLDGLEKPTAEKLPEPYRFLISWYQQEFISCEPADEEQGLLELLRLPELGSTDWLRGSADEFVATLRSHWS